MCCVLDFPCPTWLISLSVPVMRNFGHSYLLLGFLDLLLVDTVPVDSFK